MVIGGVEPHTKDTHFEHAPMYGLMVIALANAFFDVRLEYLCSSKLFDRLESYAQKAKECFDRRSKEFGVGVNISGFLFYDCDVEATDFRRYEMRRYEMRRYEMRRYEMSRYEMRRYEMRCYEMRRYEMRRYDMPRCEMPRLAIFSPSVSASRRTEILYDETLKSTESEDEQSRVLSSRFTTRPSQTGFFDDDVSFYCHGAPRTSRKFEASPSQSTSGGGSTTSPSLFGLGEQPTNNSWSDEKRSLGPHTFTSVLFWAAADRVARVASIFIKDNEKRHKAAYWDGVAKDMRGEIIRNAFHKERNSFTTFWHGETVGPSLLRMAEVGFVAEVEDSRRGEEDPQTEKGVRTEISVWTMTNRGQQIMIFMFMTSSGGHALHTVAFSFSSLGSSFPRRQVPT